MDYNFQIVLFKNKIKKKIINKFNKHGFQVYKCRFHGGQNTNFYGFRDRANRGGFNKPGYTDEKKIKSLASLKQFIEGLDKADKETRSFSDKLGSALKTGTANE